MGQEAGRRGPGEAQGAVSGSGGGRQQEAYLEEMLWSLPAGEMRKWRIKDDPFVGLLVFVIVVFGH